MQRGQVSDYSTFGIPGELSVSRAAFLAGLSVAAFNQHFVRTGRTPHHRPTLGARTVIRTTELEEALGRELTREDARRLDSHLRVESYHRRQRAIAKVRGPKYHVL